MKTTAIVVSLLLFHLAVADPLELPGNGQMFWVSSWAIQRADLDGTGVTELVSSDDSGASFDVALDPVGGHVYWTAGVMFTSLVRRANLYGEQIEFFPGNGGKGGPGALATDLYDRDLYVIDPSDCTPLCGQVQRIDLDGEPMESVVASNLPIAFAVVRHGLDRLCWSDVEDDTIRCSDLAGNGAQLIVDQTTSYGLAIHAETEQIYWTDRDAGRLRRANLDGSGPEDIVTTDLSRPIGIAIDPVAGKVYWTDSVLGKIERANLDGGKRETLLTGLDSPQGIALDYGQGACDLGFDDGALRWNSVPGAWSYDVVRGDLGLLRVTGGDLTAAAALCLIDDTTSAEGGDEATPAAGEGFWYVVRTVTATGNGTYDTGRSSQVASRDAGIAASSVDCP